MDQVTANVFALGNNVVKFNGLNYADWSEQIQFQLGVMDLDLAVVTDEMPPVITETSTEADRSYLEAWERSNTLSLSLMRMSTAENVKSSMPKTNNAREFMKKVKEHSQLDISDNVKAGGRNSVGSEKQVTALLRATCQRPHEKEAIIKQELDVPHETIQVPDIVLREKPSLEYSVIGRSFFSPKLGPIGQLGDGAEYWRGFYQSLRPTQMGLSLNIGSLQCNYSNLLSAMPFQHKYHDSGREVTINPRVGRWNMINKVKYQDTGREVTVRFFNLNRCNRESDTVPPRMHAPPVRERRRPRRYEE